MRITHEADYAIRILYLLCLLPEGGKMGASVLAEQAKISLRFALKILRKLMISGLVISYKGARGGYALKSPPEQISLGRVIELIDGPIQLNHCIDEGFLCQRVSDKELCSFHRAFESVCARLREELYAVTFETLIQ